MSVAGNVKINGVPLWPPPSRFIPHAPKPQTPQAINGVYVPSVADFGWSFDLIYGSDGIIDDEAVEMLQSVLGGPGSVMDITWTDNSNNEHTKVVAIIEEIAPAYRWGTNTETLTVTLYEVDEYLGGS